MQTSGKSGHVHYMFQLGRVDIYKHYIGKQSTLHEWRTNLKKTTVHNNEPLLILYGMFGSLCFPDVANMGKGFSIEKVWGLCL
jgi:hypothetical protein